MQNNDKKKISQKDLLDEFDEYVQASLEDFLNLHNGLFTVNMSNNYSVEMQLSPPIIHDENLVDLNPDAVSFLFPVLYPFGTINFLFSI